jgi:MFS family permease
VEFDVSYAALGLLVSVMNVASGLCQLPAGVLVDRFGARPLLVGGLLVMGGGIALIGVAPGFTVILLLAALSGVGNSVIHPADYAVLAHAIKPDRVGRAFAVHTFCGNVGFMIAPTSILLMTGLWGWRGAVIAAGSISLLVALAVLRWGHLLAPLEADSAATTAPEATATGAGLRPLLTPSIMMMFMFFVVIAMITSGFHSFAVTLLGKFHGQSLASANTLFTVFLVAGSVGVLLGGAIADRTRRHVQLTGVVMAIGAVGLFVMGQPGLSFVALFAILLIIGGTQGMIRPSRDMIVRSITPPGATGRVFAFVSTGLNVGAAITPVLFGYLIDLGYVQAVFYVMAAIMFVGIATIGVTGWKSSPVLAESRPGGGV